MWDFLTKKCGIFGIEGGGDKTVGFSASRGDIRPLTSGHTGYETHWKKVSKLKEI